MQVREIIRKGLQCGHVFLSASNIHAWQIGHLRGNNLTTSFYEKQQHRQQSMPIKPPGVFPCVPASECKSVLAGFYLSIFVVPASKVK